MTIGEKMSIVDKSDLGDDDSVTDRGPIVTRLLPPPPPPVTFRRLTLVVVTFN